MRKTIKTLLLTLLIIMFSVSGISADGPSTTAGQGGRVVTINVDTNTPDPVAAPAIADTENVPSENTTETVGYTTTTTKVSGDTTTQKIEKPGTTTEVEYNKETGITTAQTSTEYGATTKTVIDNNTGITTIETINNDDSKVYTVVDHNASVSVSTQTDPEGKVTVVTKDLKTGISTALTYNDDDTQTKVITVPIGSEVPKDLVEYDVALTQTENTTKKSGTVTLTLDTLRQSSCTIADVFTLTVDENGEVLVKTQQKIVELTKIPNALDEKSFDVEPVQSNEITLVPRDDILTKIDDNLKANSIDYIPEDAYMSDFYELQVYLKDDASKTPTHEGLQFCVELPEYITEDVDPEKCGVVHYVQDEGIYEFVQADEVNIEDKTMTFTLRSTSPISYVIKYKDTEPATPTKAKCIIHWFTLLSIIIYIIASLLIHDKKKGFRLINIIELIVAVVLTIIGHELWCYIMLAIALIVMLIMIILIKNANKDDDDEEEENKQEVEFKSKKVSK